MSNDLLAKFQVELEDAWQQLDILFTITEMVGQKPELKSIEAALGLLSARLGAQQGIVFLRYLGRRLKPDEMLTMAVYGSELRDWVDNYVFKLNQGIMSQIAKDGVAKIENNPCAQDPFLVQLPFEVQSFLGVPIRLADQIIGLLCLFNRGLKQGFTESDERLASAVALELGAIISSERINEFWQRMNKVISYEKNYVRICSVFLEEAMGLLEADRGFIMLLDEDKRLMTIKTQGHSLNRLKSSFIPAGEGILGQVAELEEPQVINSPAALSQDPFLKLADQPLSSLLSVPLRCEEGVIGIVNLCDKANGFNPADLKLILSVSTQLGVAVKNLQRYIQLNEYILEKLYLNGKLPEEVLNTIIHSIESIYTNVEYVLGQMMDTDPNKRHILWIKNLVAGLDMIFKDAARAII